MTSPRRIGARPPEVNRFDFYEKVGARMRKHRELANFSAAALGEAVGTSGPNLNKIEMGERPPPLHLIVAIAKVLGVKLEDLVPME